MGSSQYRLAKDINVPAMRINTICKNNAGISADTALRLARYFGTSVEFCTGIQSHYDTERVKMDLGDRLEKEVKVLDRVALSSSISSTGRQLLL
jgi:antitoxin HigA-1